MYKFSILLILALKLNAQVAVGPTVMGFTVGNSGALSTDCTQQVNLFCYDITDAVPLKTSANVWTGKNDFSNSIVILPAGVGPIISNGLTLTSSYVTPFGLAYGSSVIFGGDTISGKVVIDEFVATYNVILTKVNIPIGIALPAGKTFIYGIYNADCSTLLGYSRNNAPFNVPIELKAGTVYKQAFSSELEVYPLAFGANGGAGIQAALFSTTTNSHYVSPNLTSGAGVNYSLPETCGSSNVFSYYGIVTPVLRP